ncbi:DoxX family protein [Nocardia neocaledoniensis]|uniref:DoxX family protein n=1 Tax=Nocardia neocaledoniensis TaxID=236511 RepID=UPI00245881FF|nr:DoxX family protein [Nocardia neocaledoniensis]
MSAVDTAALILRLTLGAVVLAHGINHAWGDGKLAGTAGWFASIGLRPEKLHAVLATATEIAAGLLLIVGLLTPFAAAAVVSTMTVALITAHLRHGFFIFRPGQGWEYTAVLAAMALATATLGPGRWSVDHLVDIDTDGMTALAITAVLGVGSAALLLAAYWRPAPRENP